MNYYPFRALLNSVAASNFVGAELAHFRIDPSAGFFVEPQLTLKFEIQSAPIQLVSARGAAGKSRSGREISNRLQLPLWRLEEDKAISGAALELNLARYLRTAEVARALSEQDAPGIVIDSLDEARTRVSAVSWIEFARSIAVHVKAGLKVVALGRERTLEDLWSIVEDEGVDVDWWEISHLGEEDAEHYVDEVARVRDPEAAVGSEPYLRARRAVIDALHRSLPERDREAFVGYPPVLDAVSALLIRKPNYLSIANQFDEAQSADGLMEVLRQILTNLLRREQGKIVPLLNDLGIGGSALYDESEQLDWLMHHLEGAPRPTVATITNEKARAEYVNKLGPMLKEHPFRTDQKWASSVFEAYAAAQRFSQGFPGQRLVEVGNHSGLLFDLMAGTPSLAVDESQFAALHGSLIAGQGLGASTSVQVELDTADGDVLTASVVKVQGKGSQSLDMTIFPATTGEFQLLGPLTSLSVTYPGQVTVPHRASQTVLGPDLFVACEHFEVAGQSLSIARAEIGSGSPGTTIEAKTVALPPEAAELPRPADLEILMPAATSLPYPWFGCVAELDTQESPNDRAVRFLNMLMALTRLHGHDGERGVFDKKLEGRQSIKRDEFQSAITALVKMGVLRRDGNMIFVQDSWEPHRFSGRPVEGQRTIQDVLDTWRPVLDAVAAGLRR